MARCQKLRKADSDDLKTIFIQTIATCQKVKKADSDDLRINFIQAIATCQKVKKADSDDLRYSGKCYMPESEESGPPMF